MTAASATVIGTRTAGLEAMFLASCRIRSGEWDKAMVVMADESHPTIDAVLGHCTSKEVRSGSAGMAFLIERMDASHSESLPEMVGFDRSIMERGLWRSGVRGRGALAIPEIGCVAGPAALALEIAGGHSGNISISCTDPNGFAWTLHAKANGIPQAFATV
jgi:hypothetical protein